MRSTVLKVKCKCDYILFKYLKIGKGKLVRCYIPRILEDHVGVSKVHIGDKPTCPECKKEVGIVINIKGMNAVKLNQGTIQQIRIG